jgi:hypothetical protein
MFRLRYSEDEFFFVNKGSKQPNVQTSLSLINPSDSNNVVIIDPTILDLFQMDDRFKVVCAVFVVGVQHNVNGEWKTITDDFNDWSSDMCPDYIIVDCDHELE